MVIPHLLQITLSFHSRRKGGKEKEEKKVKSLTNNKHNDVMGEKVQTLMPR
jgi:hypothetical protein